MKRTSATYWIWAENDTAQKSSRLKLVESLVGVNPLADKTIVIISMETTLSLLLFYNYDVIPITLLCM